MSCFALYRHRNIAVSLCFDEQRKPCIWTVSSIFYDYDYVLTRFDGPNESHLLFVTRSARHVYGKSLTKQSLQEKERYHHELLQCPIAFLRRYSSKVQRQRCWREPRSQERSLRLVRCCGHQCSRILVRGLCWCCEAQEAAIAHRDDVERLTLDDRLSLICARNSLNHAAAEERSSISRHSCSPAVYRR